MVSYTYRADDPLPSEDGATPSRAAKAPEVKTFSFYTVVDLGPSVVSKDDKSDAD